MPAPRVTASSAIAPGERPSKSQARSSRFLGPSQADNVLGVIGRSLDERQGLEHRVVDVRGHLGPLLGQGSGLALGDEIAQQTQPPGPEDDHHRGHHHDGAGDRSQRGGRGVAVIHHQEPHPAQPDEHAEGDSDDDDPAAPTFGVLGDEGHDVVMEEGAFGLPRVAPDEHAEADREDAWASR